MKIGITAKFGDNGYGRWGKDIYNKLKEHGYSCSDFDMANTESLLYTLPQNESDKILIDEKLLAEKAGIEINQVHGPWRWPPRDFTKEDLTERMEKMKKSIRSSSVLGCCNWVVHPIMPFGINEAGKEEAKKTWDMNIEFMSELLITAKEYGIIICLENMPMTEFSLATPKDILKLVKYINDDNFKICLDTGHVSVFSGLSLGDSVRELGDEIRVLHVHDNMHHMDLHLMPYFGIIDWDEFAKALKVIEYNGSFSLETTPPKKFPDEIFEEMCITLSKIANNIINK